MKLSEVAIGWLCLVGIVLGNSVFPQQMLAGYAHNYCANSCYNEADMGNGNGKMKGDWNKTPEWVEATQNTSGPIPADDSLAGKNCQCKLNGDGSHTWCGYPYQCAAYDWIKKDETYTNGAKSSGAPWIFTYYYDNNSSTNDTLKFTRSEQTTAQYTWSITNTLEVGVSMTISASIPDVMSVSDTFSTKFSVSTQATNSRTHTQSWSIEQDIVEPPHATTKVQVIVTKMLYRAQYHANIQFGGYGEIWCCHRTQNHYCWFIPPSNFLKAPCDAAKSTCPTGGTFNGVQGVNVYVKKEICKLGVRC